MRKTAEKFGLFMDFVRGLQLGNPSDRLAELDSCLRHTLASLDNGEHGRGLSELERARRFAMVSEASELIAIFEEFGDELRKFPARLKKILKGAAFPGDESPSSAEARNITFELALAAGLRHGGLAAFIGPDHLSDQADIGCWVDQQFVFIECKRVLSEKGFAPAVRKAQQQLRKRLSLFSPRRLPPVGLIAVSVSREFYDKFTAFPMAKSKPELDSFIDDVIEMICLRHYEEILRVRETPGILGVLVHSIGPAFSPDRHHTYRRCALKYVPGLSSHLVAVAKRITAALDVD